MRVTRTAHFTAVGDISKLTRGMARWSFGEKISLTVPYEGAYEKCLAARPLRGSQLAGFSNDGLRVISSELEEMAGGIGKLTVNLEAELPEAEDVTTEAIGEPTFTIDWIEDQVKLETLPQCGYISGDGTAAGITDLSEEWEKIEANPTYYQDRGESDSWSYDDYVSLKSKGVESALVYYPKVTRTTYHFAKPSDLGEKCGKRQEPPIPSFNRLADFEWLAGADSATRSGKVYERRSEWIGQRYWEPKIYPAT